MPRPLCRSSDYGHAAAPKLAMVGNVRAALILVARGEAPLGIVYATDAKVEPAVKIIGVFPDNSHDPIVYPAAAIGNAKPAAKFYLSLPAFCGGAIDFRELRL